VGPPGGIPSFAPGIPPEGSLLGDQEAVAGVPALLLVMENALERRGEEPLHLLAKLGQRASRSGRRRDCERGAEVREVMVEVYVPGLPLDRLGVQAGQNEAWVAAVGQADALRRQDREAVVTVVPNELVGLRVAVRQRRSDEGSRQETDLASSVGVRVVEGERLRYQAAQPTAALPNAC